MSPIPQGQREWRRRTPPAHLSAASLASFFRLLHSARVRRNLADFPSAVLDPHAIQAITADDFIANTIELDPSEAILALRRVRERFKNPALGIAALIHKSESQGLLQVATFMDEYQSFL